MSIATAYSNSAGAQISISRRSFLKDALGAGAGVLTGFGPLHAETTVKKKVVVVTFGGGARDEETFAPEGQRNIPNLLSTLLPRSTFFTHVVNRGILGHYVATASLATGCYEKFDNFAPLAPANPTIFEYLRKASRTPAQNAWVVAPGNGFGHLGESVHRAYGGGLGASVILPTRLVNAAMTSDPNDSLSHLLRDDYETPFYDPSVLRSEQDHHQIETILEMSLSEFRAHAQKLDSPDELSVFIARQIMDRYAPTLLWITLHDMDVAHTGAYSLYIDAIRRTDTLCADIWNAIEASADYAGRTTMFILPDFGRDSDFSAGGNGFQHHRTGDALSRTTWMMALGHGIREGVFVDRPVESIDLIPTIGSLLRIPTPYAAGKKLTELTGS